MRRLSKLGKKGFTLVEIMIVVAIIILLAAIAIPNLLRARLNANESAAVGATRTISTAMESFRAAQTPPQYPASLGALTATAPFYIDTVLAGGTKQGYTFAYTSATTNVYTITANPQTPNVTGIRGFFVDESGVIRAQNPAPATVASPVIQ
jgi:type IV pilus assembly protein PilA